MDNWVVPTHRQSNIYTKKNKMQQYNSPSLNDAQKILS